MPVAALQPLQIVPRIGVLGRDPKTAHRGQNRPCLAASGRRRVQVRGAHRENCHLATMSRRVTVLPQSQQPEPPCTGFLGAVQDFTGGESNQAWYDDVADNFIDTKDTVASSVLSTGLSMAGASTTAKSWGGVTLLQLGQQAWNANYGPVRTPGLWSFRAPTAAVGTAAASWVVNAVLIKGAYNSGVLTGSLIRTGVNRAAGAMCARP
jgi:hypothetical protein